MNIQEVITKAQDALTVKKVFGEPFEKDGVTVIPAAQLRGGAGGGSGSSGSGEEGGGGGFGIMARPAGAFVIKGQEVRWQPAIDVNRALMLGLVAILTFRSVAKVGLKRGRKHK
ncbi:MAG: spore germination protein GerW family protein [Actinomycetota bacterium]